MNRAGLVGFTLLALACLSKTVISRDYPWMIQATEKDHSNFVSSLVSPWLALDEDDEKHDEFAEMANDLARLS